MLPTDRDALRQTLTSALGMYDRDASDEAVDTWLSALKAFDLARVRSAIRDHMDHPEDGKRAPRPVDIWRRLSHGGGKGSQCGVVAPDIGRCEYPGIFSDGTDGSGQWYCPWHREARTGPAAIAIIEQSRVTPYADAMAARVAKMNAGAAESPAVRRVREAMAARARTGPARREPGDDEEQAA